MTTNKTKPRTVVGGVVIHHGQSANLDEIYAEQERLYIERDRLRADNARLREALQECRTVSMDRYIEPIIDAALAERE